MLLCTVFQGTLVQEVYVHSLNQDERTQISASHRNIQDNKDYKRIEILSSELDIPTKKFLLQIYYYCISQ